MGRDDDQLRFVRLNGDNKGAPNFIPFFPAVLIPGLLREWANAPLHNQSIVNSRGNTNRRNMMLGALYLWQCAHRAIARHQNSVVCGQRASVTSSRDAHIYSRESKTGLAPDQQCPPFRAQEMQWSVSFLTTNLH